MKLKRVLLIRFNGRQMIFVQNRLQLFSLEVLHQRQRTDSDDFNFGRGNKLAHRYILCLVLRVWYLGN